MRHKIISEARNEDNDHVFTFEDGKTVIVTPHVVTFDGCSGSNVDYYYDDGPGYGCETEEEVAIQYHKNFA
jgi:hypothetical protein